MLEGQAQAKGERAPVLRLQHAGRAQGFRFLAAPAARPRAQPPAVRTERLPLTRLPPNVCRCPLRAPPGVPHRLPRPHVPRDRRPVLILWAGGPGRRRSCSGRAGIRVGVVGVDGPTAGAAATGNCPEVGHVSSVRVDVAHDPACMPACPSRQPRCTLRSSLLSWDSTGTFACTGEPAALLAHSFQATCNMRASLHPCNRSCGGPVGRCAPSGSPEARRRRLTRSAPALVPAARSSGDPSQRAGLTAPTAALTPLLCEGASEAACKTTQRVIPCVTCSTAGFSAVAGGKRHCLMAYASA